VTAKLIKLIEESILNYQDILIPDIEELEKPITDKLTLTKENSKET